MAKKADINIETLNITYNFFDESVETPEPECDIVEEDLSAPKDYLITDRKLLYTWQSLDELKLQLARLDVGDILALMEVDENGEQKLTGPIMHFVVADRMRVDPDTDKGVLMFVAEDVLFDHCMDSDGASCDKFEDTELYKYLNTEFKAKLNRDICKLLVGDIRIPTAGQVFGRSDEWANDRYVMDDCERWQLMKSRKNRIAVDKNDDVRWWWLANKIKPEYSAATFACVFCAGSAGSTVASDSLGVRPAFSVRIDL